LNSVIHSGTGYSPAYLNFGRELRLPSALDEKEMQDMQPDRLPPKDWAHVVKKLREICLLVKDNLEYACKKASKYYNLRRRDVTFGVGQLVVRKAYALSSAPKTSPPD
jgi:hypothetical protein